MDKNKNIPSLNENFSFKDLFEEIDSNKKIKLDNEKAEKKKDNIKL